MATDRRTLNLFDWQPPVVAHKAEKVRAASFRAKLAKAVSTTLKECGRTRANVASEMSAMLDAEISEHVLNAAASESREDHLLNPERLWALCTVTGDFRPVAVLLDRSDNVLIDKRWLGAVREAIATAEKERLDVVIKAARREWRGA
ncbi:MAG: DNA transposition protein [Rhodospirillales bacterium]|nr:DNA transposition protein [Rhodospirillales bacterium]